MLIAKMFVKAKLSSIKAVVNAYIRDGKLSLSGNQYPSDLREDRMLESESRHVWSVNSSAIVADYRTDELTELRLLAVKGIVYDLPAKSEWDTIEFEFKKMGLLVRSEPTWGQGGIPRAAYAEVILRDGPRPEQADEQEYRQKRRVFYKVTPVHDHLHMDTGEC